MLNKEQISNFDLLEFVRQNPIKIEPFSQQFKSFEHDFERDFKYSFECHFKAAGIIEFLPKKPSNQYLILSSGVHGNETAPMEIINDMVADLLRGELELSLNLLIIIGNPLAMIEQQRFTEFNLNRLFDGKWQEYLANDRECYEAKRAQEIEHFVHEFYQKSSAQDVRYHYDLHTAIRASKHEKFAIYPYLGERQHDFSQLNFLADCGVNTCLLYHKPSTTFSYFTSANFNAHAFTVELGKVRPFGENNRQDFAQAENTLRKFVSGDYQFDGTKDKYNLNLFSVKKELLRISDDSVLNVESETANFTEYAKGFELLSDPNKPYFVEEQGEAVVFPNNKVPIGQRMALVVINQ